MKQLVMLLAATCLISGSSVLAGGFYSPTYGPRGRVYSNWMNNWAGQRQAAQGRAVKRGNRYYINRTNSTVPYFMYQYPSFRADQYGSVRR